MTYFQLELKTSFRVAFSQLMFRRCPSALEMERSLLEVGCGAWGWGWGGRGGVRVCGGKPLPLRGPCVTIHVSVIFN